MTAKQTMSEKQKSFSVMEDLLSKVPNRFVLAVGAARRGRQILEGANPLALKAPRTQPILCALGEIQEEKVKIVMKKEEEAD